MRVPSPLRIATLTLLVGGLACAKNTANENVGAARDSTAARVSDSTRATNTDQSGVKDSSGNSTLGPNVTKTRPDQGQPVTAKGDTLNPGVDSSPGYPAADSSTNRMGADSSMNRPGAGAMDSSVSDTSTAR